MKQSPQRFLSRSHGNVLIMAIFIAVFIYFLAIALIAQNRQDIMLALTEDHRFRANMAASSGLDMALHVMRTNPLWASVLIGKNGELPSGGSWTITDIRTYPQAPHCWEIICQGTSGLMSITRHRIVEEIAFGKDAKHANTLFAKTEDNKLAVLGPDFCWSTLGILPDTQTALVANQGPLFTLSPSHNEGPAIFDIQNQHYQSVYTATPSRSPLWLKFSEKTVSWEELCPPSAALMSSSSSSKAAAAKASAGILGNAQAAVLSGTTYTGPSVSWYIVTGLSMAADDQSNIYCHAIHYYYVGAKATLKNRVDSLEQLAELPATDIDVKSEGKLYQAPALVEAKVALESSSSQIAWKVNSNALQVGSLGQTPTIKESEIPNRQTLVYHQGGLYALSKNNPKVILKADGTKWNRQASAAGVSLGLFSYDNQLLTHKYYGQTNGFERFDFSSSLETFTGISCDRPAVYALDNAETSAESANLGESLQPRELFPRRQIYTNLLCNIKKTTAFIENSETVVTAPSETADTSDLYVPQSGANTVAVCGQDLYAFVKLTKKLTSASPADLIAPYKNIFNENGQSDPANGEASRASQCLAIAHYDGQAWQLWPDGLFERAAFTIPEKSAFIELSGFKLKPESLAASRYQNLDTTTQSRFTVILDQPR